MIPSDISGHPLVLLVEDDAAQRRGYRRALRSLGFTVEEAESGDEASRRLQTESFDAIVSDITLPGMSGIDLLRMVRRRDLDVPVVLMTGDPKIETAIEAIEYGALRYLLKPVNVDVLQAAVRDAVRLHRLAKLKREAVQLVGDSAKQLGDRAGLEAGFERALDSLQMAFQPIVSLARQRSFAYEALLRSSEPTLPNPGAVLAAAERLGRIHEVGRAVRDRVARALPDAPTQFVFVNVHSSDLLDDRLYDASTPFSKAAARIVLEITERAALDNVKNVEGCIVSLRKLGFRIAIDDLGAGYAGLTSFAQLKPEIVKFDMSLIRGIDSSPLKQNLVGAMSDLFREMGLEVVCEGVETIAERDTLARLGCDLVQGYLLAKPAIGFPIPVFGP